MKQLADRLGVTETQVQMAYYSGAIPKNIDPEPFIQHWEARLLERRAQNKPKVTIYDTGSSASILE